MLDHVVAALGVVLLAAACIYWPAAAQEPMPPAIDLSDPLQAALLEQRSLRRVYDQLEVDCATVRTSVPECTCPVGRCKRGRRLCWPEPPPGDQFYRNVRWCPEEQLWYIAAAKRTAARLAELCFTIMRLQNATMPDQRCRQCEVRGYDTVEDCRAED